MSGHSKWATTKHKKAVIDAKRGKLFAKLIKNIEVAAKQGGGDPAGNPTLYDAIQKAKKSSVPNDNIDRAVKRGSGAEAGAADYQTIMYEVYGPQGVALAATVGYSGLLGGPPLVGMVAEHLGLPVALTAVALFTASVRGPRSDWALRRAQRPSKPSD